MVNCQQLYFCFPYKSLYKVILKCKRKVVYWSYMHVLYNLMYRLKWTLYRLYEIMKIFSTWKYIVKLILSRSKACFFSKSIKAIIPIWRRTFSRLSYAKIVCIFLAFDAKYILHSLCRKMLKKGKNVFLHIYVCIICCWHILLGWAITWWHYSSYVMLGNKFKPKLFFVRTSMLSSFIYYCLFVSNFANILY